MHAYGNISPVNLSVYQYILGCILRNSFWLEVQEILKQNSSSKNLFLLTW